MDSSQPRGASYGVLPWAREETCADYDKQFNSCCHMWKVCLRSGQPIHRSSQGMTGRGKLGREGGLRKPKHQDECVHTPFACPPPAWMSKEITEGEKAKMFLTILQAALHHPGENLPSLGHAGGREEVMVSPTGLGSHGVYL